MSIIDEYPVSEVSYDASTMCRVSLWLPLAPLVLLSLQWGNGSNFFLNVILPVPTLPLPLAMSPSKSVSGRDCSS